MTQDAQDAQDAQARRPERRGDAAGGTYTAGRTDRDRADAPAGGDRADLQAWVRELTAPLLRYASPGGARFRLGVNTAHHDDAAADLEGYARPLWGLAPLAAGGGEFAHWDVWVRGLDSGTDPAHPEFWGEPGDVDQRLVETAAIGFALALVPERLWDPLSGAARDRVGRWLAGAVERETPANNWNFFPVLVGMGLDRVGHRHDASSRRARLDRLEGYALGGGPGDRFAADDAERIGAGWYSDGATAQRDYYIPWAMHFYGLLYAALAGPADPARAARFRERAARFAAGFRHWFADDGSAVPYGRSLTYRFAQGAFWGALPYADVTALPHGEVKGLLLRHLRGWRRRGPLTSPDGLLTVGYGYPQPAVAEQYNGPGSPYWAMKAFLPLALPERHPFWTAPELPPAALPATLVQPEAGALLMRSGGDVTLLGARQHNTWVRGGAAKYAKFAYSTRFGFSLPAGGLGAAQGAYDSVLALSDDTVPPGAEPVHFRVRETCEEFRVEAWRAGAPGAEATRSGEAGAEAPGEGKAGAAGGDLVLVSTWRPWADVEVTTWLAAAAPWHLRVHRVRTGRALHAYEGGFAVDRDAGLDRREETAGSACAVSAAGDLSGLRDLPAPADREQPDLAGPTDRVGRLDGLGRADGIGRSDGIDRADGIGRSDGLGRADGGGPAAGPGAPPRAGRVLDLLPGTNVLARRTVLPVLVTHLPPGEHWLRCAVLGAAAAEATAWNRRPPAPPR
jgi:hypothetical protein